MSLIAWLVLGLAAGFIGSGIVNNRGEGIIASIIVGLIGALIGGFLFDLFGARGVTGFNLWSLLVAACGSVVLLLVYHFFQRAPRSMGRREGHSS